MWRKMWWRSIKHMRWVSVIIMLVSGTVVGQLNIEVHIWGEVKQPGAYIRCMVVTSTMPGEGKTLTGIKGSEMYGYYQYYHYYKYKYYGTEDTV